MKGREAIESMKASRASLAAALREGAPTVLELITTVIGSPEDYRFNADPHQNAFSCGRRSVFDELRELAETQGHDAPALEVTDGK